MKRNDIKMKLKALSVSGVLPMMVDFTKLLEKVTLDIDSAEEEDIQYARLVKSVVDKLRRKYKEQLQGQEVASKQTDLEVLIERIKDGSKPKWENKLIDNGE